MWGCIDIRLWMTHWTNRKLDTQQLSPRTTTLVMPVVPQTAFSWLDRRIRCESFGVNTIMIQTKNRDDPNADITFSMKKIRIIMCFSYICFYRCLFESEFYRYSDRETMSSFNWDDSLSLSLSLSLLNSWRVCHARVSKEKNGVSSNGTLLSPKNAHHRLWWQKSQLLCLCDLQLRLEFRKERTLSNERLGVSQTTCKLRGKHLSDSD
jgi:hypothetical protein